MGGSDNGLGDGSGMGSSGDCVLVVLVLRVVFQAAERQGVVMRRFFLTALVTWFVVLVVGGGLAFSVSRLFPGVQERPAPTTRTWFVATSVQYLDDAGNLVDVSIKPVAIEIK